MRVWIPVVILGALVALRPRAAAGVTVRTKSGVVLDDLHPAMERALPLIELAHTDAGIGERKDDYGQPFYGAFYTSGRDSAPERKKTTLHAVGKAVDLRTKDLKPGQVGALLKALRARLPREYEVVDETRVAGRPHIHVEYDPK